MFLEQQLWPVTCHGSPVSVASVQCSLGSPKSMSGFTSIAEGPPRVWVVKPSPVGWAALRSPRLPAPPREGMPPFQSPDWGHPAGQGTWV